MGRMMSSKAMLAFAVFVLVGVSVNLLVVEGVRDLQEVPKKAAEEVQHPDNFLGGPGGLGGFFPGPPGSSTIPGFGPPTGGPGVGSSVDFCSLPGLGCVRVQPNIPGQTGTTGGQGGSSTPLPFP